MDMGLLTRMRVFPCTEAPFLWTWAFEQLEGCLSPPSGHQPSGYKSAGGLPTWRCAFSRGVGGCFPMCRVRFFLPPWTHVGPLKEFLRGFVSQNHIPSCLLPPPLSAPPPRGDPGSGVLMYSDPWPQDNRVVLGSNEETSPLPTPHPFALGKHVFPSPVAQVSEASSPG